MDKSSDAFRTISEVAVDLDLPQHVLRFWETRFSQIKPLKRGGGRRYYRPDDVDLLRGIRHLLYGEGYTIRGVQRILKEQGVRFVMTLWQEGAPGLEEVRRQDRGEPDMDFGADAGDAEADYGVDDGGPAYGDPVGYASTQPRLMRGQDRALQQADKPRGPVDQGRTVALVPIEQRGIADGEPLRGWQAGDAAAGESDDASLHALAQRFAPTGPTAAPVAARDVGEPAAAARSPLSPLIDRLRPGHGRNEAEAELPAAGHGGLARDDVRRLQATLFELLECKRLLDQAR